MAHVVDQIRNLMLGNASQPLPAMNGHGLSNGRVLSDDDSSSETDQVLELRHGLSPAQELEALMDCWFYWVDARPLNQSYFPPPDLATHWRNRDRPKTSNAVLVVCIRLGVEPPDVVKTKPCATLECWVETAVIDKDKALAEVGQNLEKQYISLASSKVKYKRLLDCKSEELKRSCQTLRKTAKHERGLLHYNGHGVPKPTATGEIWVFDSKYTQYVPITPEDLLSKSRSSISRLRWIGSPSIFVWDCSAAGNVVNKIEELVAHRDNHIKMQARNNPNFAADAIPQMDVIQLAACTSNQNLPQNPDLPADLFTSCLTSPIETALRFFILRNPLKADLDLSLAFKIPGKLSERRSPLGELVWIFTTITDTIAWNTLPTSTFQRLFRHDLLVAALFRGFLLAERIMRHYDCTPISVPVLPPMHNHPMWDTWDLAVDRCLSQLPAILAQEKLRMDAVERGDATIPPEIPYQYSRFFSDQLQAFEIWLDQGTARTTAVTLDGVTKMPRTILQPSPNGSLIKPHKVYPELLPIVLQVLLSQTHRVRALLALCHFLDFGPWAVQLSLQIGIFPYILKLLQAPSMELKPVLIYIWARILGVYRSCQEDLLKAVAVFQGQTNRPDLPYMYFVKVLQPTPPVRQRNAQGQGQSSLPIPNVSEHRAMCAFILSILCRDYDQGKLACLQPNAPVMESCLTHLEDRDPLLRQWACLCLAQQWDDSADAKAKALTLVAHEKLTEMLVDDLPDVRAAVLYALGTLIGCTGSTNLDKRSSVSLTGSLLDILGMEPAAALDIELGLAMAVLKTVSDGSPAVRRELVIFLSGIVAQHPANLILAAFQATEEERLKEETGSSTLSTTAAEDRADLVERTMRAESTGEANAASDSTFKSIIFSCVYKTLLDLAGDPFPRVSEPACMVIDYIHMLLLESPLGHNVDAFNDIQTGSSKKSDDHLSRRTGSVAVALSKLTHFSGFGDQTPESKDFSRTALPSPDEQPAMSRKSVSEEDLRSLRFDKSKVDATIAQLEQFTRQSKFAKTSTTSTPPSAHTPISKHSAPLMMGEDELPLRSDFYDYASKFFREPQFRQPAEAAEPGSELYNTRLWKREKANRIVTQTSTLSELATRSKWEEQIAFFNMASDSSRETHNLINVQQLVFHQFEDILVGADSLGRISCFDWRTNKRLSRFWNDPMSKKSRVTSLKIINETDRSFLLTGSADGCIRVFRDYDSSRSVLHTAFRAVSDYVPSTRQDAGLVTDWQQNRGHLIVGGNTKVLRIWDASKDSLLSEIPTRSNSCVTSITSDQVDGNLVVAGFGDGIVRVFDRRHPQRDQMVRAYRGQHSGWINNVRLQSGGSRELMSGSIAGEICFWDIRAKDPLKTVKAHSSAMSVCDLHDHAPVFATGSEHQVVKVWSANALEGPSPLEPISKFRNGAGHPYLSQRRAQGALPGTTLRSLVFHPHNMVLAVGSEEGHINVYRSDLKGSS